jgi:hypothetical protein
MGMAKMMMRMAAGIHTKDQSRRRSVAPPCDWSCMAVLRRRSGGGGGGAIAGPTAAQELPGGAEAPGGWSAVRLRVSKKADASAARWRVAR